VSLPRLRWVMDWKWIPDPWWVVLAVGIMLLGCGVAVLGGVLVLRVARQTITGIAMVLGGVGLVHIGVVELSDAIKRMRGRS
jgi:uncharacterized membrane protein HdeD (DUF308 family)